MQNLPFVLWLLGWPVVRVIENLSNHATGQNFSEGVQTASALLALAIWIFVATLLYKRNSSEKH